MLLTRAVSVGALLLAWVPFTTVAQSVAPLAAGMRIRVRFQGTTQPIVGVVDTIGSDSIRLRPAGGRVASRRVALSAIDGIDVSRGQRSYGRAGAAVGTLVGVLAALAAESGRQSTSNSFEPDYSRVGAALGIACGGVVVGYVVGSQIHSEKWDAVPLTNVRVAPVSLNRVGMTVSMSF
jgi:hypothetical protein